MIHQQNIPEVKKELSEFWVGKKKKTFIFGTY